MCVTVSSCNALSSVLGCLGACTGTSPCPLNSLLAAVKSSLFSIFWISWLILVHNEFLEPPRSTPKNSAASLKARRGLLSLSSELLGRLCSQTWVWGRSMDLTGNIWFCTELKVIAVDLNSSCSSSLLTDDRAKERNRLFLRVQDCQCLSFSSTTL